MANKKTKRIKTKVETTAKINSEIDNLLTEMSKLSLEKMTTGEMKIKVEKENGVVTKDEFTITGVLGEQHMALAKKAKELVHSTLIEVKDGKTKIEFETELKV